jgi:hypothetical protein
MWFSPNHQFIGNHFLASLAFPRRRGPFHSITNGSSSIPEEEPVEKANIALHRLRLKQ